MPRTNPPAVILPHVRPTLRVAALAAIAAGCAIGLTNLAVAGRKGGPRGGQVQIPATIEDFFHPGTQPGDLNAEIFSSANCRNCHGDYYEALDVEPYDTWVASMMAQAARDPVWHAAVAIANQDVQNGGELCIRCHVPRAWVNGRSVPTDMSALEDLDYDGITCHFCHRLVDPVYSPENPAVDSKILAALDFVPQYPGNAQYVIDPNDSRRGPFDDVPMNLHGQAQMYHSPYHRDSALCGICHDVSNPVYTRQKDGTYVLNAYDAAHPTQNPSDMMPEQRTYSEWLNSTFASKGVYFADRRFGGNHPTGIMRSCQDCHMPDQFAGGCFLWDVEPFFPRPDMPQHSFAGANTWVLGAVHNLYGSDSGLTIDAVEAAQARAIAMLRNASDMEVRQIGSNIQVRVINYSGHKLPTGYPEGRRMWLNVKFLDELDQAIHEHGAYDTVAATLEESDTKVYAMHLGMSAATAAAANLPAGPSFHLVLNNVIYKDNRIPPMGFTNAAFDAVRARPVNYGYADGQYWDDTMFPVPAKAAKAIVTLFHQTSSREYMEFLRDTNVTNNAGAVAYEQWVLNGKSAPVDMDSMILDLGPWLTGDINGDGVVSIADITAVLAAFGPCPPPSFCPEDINGDGVVTIADITAVLSNFGASL